MTNSSVISGDSIRLVAHAEKGNLYISSACIFYGVYGDTLVGLLIFCWYQFGRIVLFVVWEQICEPVNFTKCVFKMLIFTLIVLYSVSGYVFFLLGSRTFETANSPFTCQCRAVLPGSCKHLFRP
jgi:hypothetical protein